MIETTNSYEAIVDTLADDLEDAYIAHDESGWGRLIQSAEALIAGATILRQWDAERESI